MNTLLAEPVEGQGPACEPTPFDLRSASPAGCLPRMMAQIRELDRRVLVALEEGPEQMEFALPPAGAPRPEHVEVWGVPLAVMTLSDVLYHIDQLVARGTPSYFITANLNYAMLTARHAELQEVNRQAAFIACDGMPIVWWSAFAGRRLPERIAGSELIYALSHWASRKDYSIFFLGGAPGIAQATADRLSALYPGLRVAGVAAPPYRPLTDAEEASLVQQIRDSRPTLLYAALGQPKGELWLAHNVERLQVPVSVQLGASFDFVAGNVPRAPRWLQRSGLEWAYRLVQEPQRLASRYTHNALFLMRMIGRDLTRTVMGCRT
jgi:N-acetylglucosaminyldiphosphoundecaprenol N-acetyl-beta-D-mannosaminyltransferase